MAVDAIGATGPTRSSQLQQAVVDQEDLFKILLTQLSYQDPLKPMDNAEFIAQLAQFTSLEQSRQTNLNIESLLTMNAASQSIGLLGKSVEVTTATGNEVGKVFSITFDQGSPKLSIELGPSRFLNAIALSQVQIIK